MPPPQIAERMLQLKLTPSPYLLFETSVGCFAYTYKYALGPRPGNVISDSVKVYV